MYDTGIIHTLPDGTGIIHTMPDDAGIIHTQPATRLLIKQHGEICKLLVETS